MFELPITTEVGGVQYHIRNKGDYRMVLDIFSILDDIELSQKERTISALIVFYEEFNSIEDVVLNEDTEELAKFMFSFFECEQEHKPSNDGLKLVDWKSDEYIIVPAINAVAGKEIRAEEYIHWYTFMAYYLSIGESIFSTVIGIREKLAKGKKLEKWENEYRTANPQYFVWDSKSIADKEAEEWIRSVWYGD